MADAMEKAAQCTECGECEERCPYSLPIREMVERYVAEYKVGKSKFIDSKPFHE
ncbi:MAG: 4Fe-4S dicluster domain-containing protein [Desulfobacteraceae bacterium]|nr:4Fe-4S dicluster domain-containing protein [Desulfobacteraceae bacterium]